MNRSTMFVNRLLPPIAVVVSCSLLSFLGWVPLRTPAVLLQSLVNPRDLSCDPAALGPTLTYLCTARVGILQFAGPVGSLLLLSGVTFVFRRQLRGFLGARARQLPRDPRLIALSLIATALFTMSWSTAHQGTAGAMGIVPETLFPALVGLYTFLISRYAAGIRRSLESFLRRRDAFPAWVRLLATFVVPFVLSAVVIGGSPHSAADLATKEQVVTLVVMILGYLLLVPPGRQANSAVTTSSERGVLPPRPA